MTAAEGHLRAFAQAITAMLWVRAEEFDLVVAPYNSGAVMIRLAERVARGQEVPFWPALLIPVYTPYRFADLTSGQAMPYDNTALIAEARETLGGLPCTARSLLFIDDEIGNGRAFEECMKVVTGARGPLRDPCSCVIVADEDGAHKSYSFEGVDVRFVPFAVRPLPNVSGVIFDLVSDLTVDAFRGVGDGLLDKKQVASILLGLPVKTLINGVPRVTDEFNREAAGAVADLARLRADFCAYIDGIIASALLRD